MTARPLSAVLHCALVALLVLVSCASARTFGPDLTSRLLASSLYPVPEEASSPVTPSAGPGPALAQHTGLLHREVLAAPGPGAHSRAPRIAHLTSDAPITIGPAPGGRRPGTHSGAGSVGRSAPPAPLMLSLPEITHSPWSESADRRLAELCDAVIDIPHWAAQLEAQLREAATTGPDQAPIPTPMPLERVALCLRFSVRRLVTRYAGPPYTGPSDGLPVKELEADADLQTLSGLADLKHALGTLDIQFTGGQQPANNAASNHPGLRPSELETGSSGSDTQPTRPGQSWGCHYSGRIIRLGTDGTLQSDTASSATITWCPGSRLVEGYWSAGPGKPLFRIQPHDTGAFSKAAAGPSAHGRQQPPSPGGMALHAITPWEARDAPPTGGGHVDGWAHRLLSGIRQSVGLDSATPAGPSTSTPKTAALPEDFVRGVAETEAHHPGTRRSVYRLLGDASEAGLGVEDHFGPAPTSIQEVEFNNKGILPVRVYLVVDQAMVRVYGERVATNVALQSVGRASELVERGNAQGLFDPPLRLAVRKIDVWLEDQVYVDQSGTQALLNFCRWAVDQKEEYDATLLVTGVDLRSSSSTDNKGRPRDIVGVALVGTACTRVSCALAEDLGPGSIKTSAQTIAHELGHVLGATHDGIDNNCQYSSNNASIMSPVLSNNARWSTCSGREITRFVRGRWLQPGFCSSVPYNLGSGPTSGPNGGGGDNGNGGGGGKRPVRNAGSSLLSGGSSTPGDWLRRLGAPLLLAGLVWSMSL
ncbi:hypothetical protein H696_00995 [Fonticula alba]|uniref:Peptidase M12B domain-containing protein n=1 Tax=Fonticula alba TaxID=691883 RepID=A0A058ZHN7_FONAL|nr:hypothetical protein H696_00995 [Fonticula alba]KCV73461.1 hypothetical protein H696_00995 [Fonticula alba]|eukprot:XP_009493162.1 hypothetical protein H696_00995 [Fonticula alba]